MHDSIQPDRVIIRAATAADRDHIYRLRHQVYACELRQHTTRDDGVIRDDLDQHNEYFVATVNEVMLGFVSVTPPGPGGYSLDKYLRREEFPELLAEKLYEIRLLTVLNPYRGRELALLLMYAAFRWVESAGGNRIAAIGRREVLGLYLRVGLKSLGLRFRSGAVSYELLTAQVAQMRDGLRKYTTIINRLERNVEWQLACPFRQPAACFHGGAFFKAVGESFDQLDRRHEIINADVLDAWFPPSPKVISALQEHLPWLLRTSPPTGCDGMIRAIANARGVSVESILPGAGSSALIFLALRQWLTPAARVLILDPTYGEYAHVLEQVVRCRVDRFRLVREKNYRVDVNRLRTFLRRGYDLVILVNPNSPTGQHLSRCELETLLRQTPSATRVWIDETYIEYAGAEESLERFAAASRNVIVCKSMSKVYALSGVRAAYLCGPAEMISELRAITPPWAVSLPAQVAAVAALQDADYYDARYRETHRLREELAADLSAATNWEVLPGTANFLLCQLPERGPTAHEIVKAARERNLFLRDAKMMGQRLGDRTIRIAVKSAEQNLRMVEIISEIVRSRESALEERKTATARNEMVA